METKCKLLTAYHPQTDGQTERVNQKLCRYLRNYIANEADTWSRVLHKAEFTYNNQKHSTTQVSPFQALYGYNPRWIISIIRTDPKVQGVKKRLENVRRIRALMAQNWEKATARQAANYNKKHSYRTFEQRQVD